jgi:4-hydroxy-tetrahydrodipicolinate reductase
MRVPVCAVLGASGRMGRAIAAELASDGAPARFFAINHERVDQIVLPEDAVLIDFSSEEGTRSAIEIALRHRAPLVSGTTGLSEETERLLDDAATRVPVLHAANMSVGVALLRRLVRQAARALGESFDVEIIETHHGAKRDAPSGTALCLAEEVRQSRPSSGDLVPGRRGLVGARAPGEIGVHAVRGGSVVGDHVVQFLGAHERLELGHRADSRAIFALGAIRAALWLRARAPGRYTLDDVVADL